MDRGDTPPWGDWPFGAAIMPFLWIIALGRTALAVVAGYGLYHRASWGRIVAIIVAILNLIRFPLGTALGIWTLVVLLGYRNSTLYDQTATG